jgi:hypothetical protein
MDKDLFQNKVTRIRIGGEPYIVFRDPKAEGITRNASFSHILRRLLLTNSDEKLVGAIDFYEDVVIAFSQDKQNGALYGFNEMLEFAFANLIPHLPINIEQVTSIFEKNQSCFNVEFGDKPSGYDQENNTYAVKLESNLFNTAQKITFTAGTNRKAIINEILQVLLNNLEENPGTYMKIEELESSIPITIKEFLFNLNLLDDEGSIKCIKRSSESVPIVGVQITNKGISHFDSQDKTLQETTQTVVNYFAPHIEAKTYGANSPVSVNIDKISTIFEGIQKQIESDPELKNKKEVFETLDKLKNEITKENNPEETKKLLNKLKNTTNWVYNNIINNPYVSGIIVDILMRSVSH